MDDLEAFDRAMRLRESDPSEAARLWRDLAERGDLDAAYNLGLLLRERLPDEAVSWLTVVANSGDEGAAFQLGVAGLEREDHVEAERWWRYAADRGHPAAAFNLVGMVDESAREVPGWLLTATRSGDRELRFRAVTRLSRLVSQTNREACLTQLARDVTRARQAGHTGLAAELMICRGILLRDGGAVAEAESVLRAAAALCAEVSDIEGEGKARSELLVLLAESDPSAARWELPRIAELGAEFATRRGDHQMAGELNLGMARLLDDD
ncbi:MAG: tetratricopeptide repeat protein [Pseudonocardiaceae bacterium]